MEITISITDRLADFLKQYASVYDEERKTDWTNDPIVCVENKRKSYTSDDYSFDGCEYSVWINDYDLTEDGLFLDIKEVAKGIGEYLKDNHNMDNEKIEEIIDDMELQLDGFYHSNEWEYDEDNIKIEVKIHYYKHYYEPVAYFLTRKEAEDYVKRQEHNLKSPRVYTKYMGYSNQGDLLELMKFGKQLGKILCDKE